MNNSEFMRDVLQRIATGPTLSKDLPLEDARRAMRIILDGQADEVQAAIFLIALRMKRETDDELKGVLEAIQQGVVRQSVNVDNLVTIVDPYDGYLRSTPAGPFVPAVLAALDKPVVSHGVDEMGPKFGASHEFVLSESRSLLGKKPGQTIGMASLEEVASRLVDDSCGWAYVSQKILAPELARLRDLRTRIVKRPCLTTIESCINALVPRKKSLMVTGFVHKPYPPVYAMLAQAAGFTDSLLIRGVEGGVVPSLTQASRYFFGSSVSTLGQTDLEPLELGIDRQERAVPLPVDNPQRSVRSVKAPGNPFARLIASHAAQTGIDALRGEPGYMSDAIAYSASVILHATRTDSTLFSCLSDARVAISDGSALSHFEAGLSD